MIYNMMLNAADRTIQQYLQQGLQFPQDATVCVIYTGSQHIYTGISHSAMANGVFNTFHAEVTAIQNMISGGDNFADYIFVMGIIERRILTPCNQCVQYLMSCGPQNSNCKVVLPNRTIPILNADALASVAENASQPLRADPPFKRSMQASVSVPVSVSAQHSNSSYLKNRVSSLMSSANDIEDETEETPKKKKGLFGNLFGKG